MTVVRQPKIRLWMKLAAFAIVGVAAMHAVHLYAGNRIVSWALAREQETLGRTIARLVVQQAADPLLVSDIVALDDIVSSTADRSDDGVAYCFVVRDGEVIASSFHDGTPVALQRARGPGELAPIVVVSEGRRILDLAEPVLDGRVGTVRIGLSMDTVAETRRSLAVELGFLTVLVALMGMVTAFVIGRRLARPASDMLAAAESFDPAATEETPKVSAPGSDEIALLGRAFDDMMDRLRAAHAEQVRVRQKSVETERLVALGSLVAGVAHEVNNPLAGLKNCVRRLESDRVPEPKRREYLSLMGEGLERIEDVVRQLLDFGRPRPASLMELKLEELAGDAVRLTAPLLRERRIACDVEIPPADTGAVVADRRMVGQALMNVLLNAVYVTPAGGRIRVAAVRRNGLAGIAVADHGPGIPPEIRERILDPFFSTKPAGEGTGLGLSVTRSIVDAHGGELTFDFPPEGGTVVTLWLRVATSEPTRAAI